MSTVVQMPHTRDQARQATRSRLLDAAEEVFAERGFHGSKLDDVAARAGYTIGAIYHNFRGKQELFLATFERMTARYIAAFERALEAGDDPVERRRNAGALLTNQLAQDSRGFLLYLEFLMYALRNRELLPQFAETFARFRDAAAAWIEREADASGVQLPLAGRDLALVMNAFTNGFGLAKLIDSTAVDDGLYDVGLELVLAPANAGARKARKGGRS
jgi:AcrR family transcriptional regulator